MNILKTIILIAFYLSLVKPTFAFDQKIENPDSTVNSLKSDLIILHTEWNDFRFLNFKKLVKQDNFKIFDMRNIYSPAKMKNQKINYFSIGR